MQQTQYHVLWLSYCTTLVFANRPSYHKALVFTNHSSYRTLLAFVNRPSYHKALAFTQCHTACSGCRPLCLTNFCQESL